MQPTTTHVTQLTRFLDPAAEARARLTERLVALGLDPEALTSLPRMTKAELEHWFFALEQAGARHVASCAEVFAVPVPQPVGAAEVH
jgi:hypothetical protein